jgi:hypothetical protein
MQIKRFLTTLFHPSQAVAWAKLQDAANKDDESNGDEDEDGEDYKEDGDD